MEEFKKKIKIRMCWLSVLSILTALAGVYAIFLATTSQKNEIIYAFQTGFSILISIMSLLHIFNYRKILKDDKRLKVENIKENDERYKAIRIKAGSPIVPVLSIIMLVFGIIAGYFNITVFYTLINVQ